MLYNLIATAHYTRIHIVRTQVPNQPIMGLRVFLMPIFLYKCAFLVGTQLIYHVVIYRSLYGTLLLLLSEHNRLRTIKLTFKVLCQMTSKYSCYQKKNPKSMGHTDPHIPVHTTLKSNPSTPWRISNTPTGPPSLSSSKYSYRSTVLIF